MEKMNIQLKSLNNKLLKRSQLYNFGKINK